ncbi:hypothetical protein GIB67_037260 [Kingdonia uniflora]|uniref:WRC domain-containing protein n=1 Tax=Kingdonia uniflora TaxID=39325 RepID=A0A7J7MS80_9MAGN|nr:hypothetical protein GIB67_037260 [Kingdonia uniflora]
MRIRKNANFLQSLLSPPPPPLPQTSPPIAPTTPPLDPPTLVCEFNRSPWDVISFLPQSELSYADGLRQVKLETDQEVKLQRVKTMKLEEDINGGDQSSNIVQRVKPKVEIKEEIEEKALIIDNLVVTTEKKKKGRKRIVGREVLNRCTKTDGRTWQCWNEADAGNTLCNHHIEQLQTYYRTVPSQKSEKSMSKAKAPTPLRRRVKKKATNTSDFYYYSGFGPLWGKKLCKAAVREIVLDKLAKEDERVVGGEISPCGEENHPSVFIYCSCMTELLDSLNNLLGKAEEEACLIINYEQIFLVCGRCVPKIQKPSSKMVVSSSEESSSSGRTIDDVEASGTIVLDMPNVHYGEKKRDCMWGLRLGNFLGLWFRALVRPGGKIEYYQFVVDLAEPNPKGVADTSSLFDVVSREGNELNKVLGELGIRREKRLNSIVGKGVNLKAVEQEALELAKRDPIRLDTQIQSSISQLSVAWRSAVEVLKVAAAERAELDAEKVSLIEQLKDVVAARNSLIQAFYSWGLRRDDVNLAIAGKYGEIIFPEEDASPVAD